MLRKVIGAVDIEYCDRPGKTSEGKWWFSAKNISYFDSDEFRQSVRIKQAYSEKSRVCTTEEEIARFKESYEESMLKAIASLEEIPTNWFDRRKAPNHKGCVRATCSFRYVDLVDTMTMAEASKNLTAKQFKQYLEESGLDAMDMSCVGAILSERV